LTPRAPIAGLRRLGRRADFWAGLIWLVCAPIALALPDVAGESPFTLRGSATPLLAGFLMLAAIGVAVARWGLHPLAGVAAGLFAAWVMLTMHTALFGSPFGFGGLRGDMARMSAMAERYTTTVHSADGIVGSVPADYPPLFPWLVGRASVLTGVPAWRLLGISETLLMSAGIVVTFALWRRLTSAWLALALTLASLAVFFEPEKPYEVIALCVVIPWSLVTFSEFSGKRLHWLPAGILGGLQVLLYPGYLLFAALGLVGLVALVWRRSGERSVYARHVVGVIAVAFVVSSWWLIPYLQWGFSHGLEMTDRYQDLMIGANPFPFTALTLVGVVSGVGVFGLLWYRGREWWVLPLLLLTLSAFAYRFVAELQFIQGGETRVFQYSVHAVAGTLVAAGVLTLARAVPALLRRLSVAPPARLGPLAVGVLAAGLGVTLWQQLLPGAPPPSGPVFRPALTSSYTPATQAFLQPLPDGRYPRFAPLAGRTSWFPIDPIVRDVHSILGPAADPVTLSYSERLFAFRPWPGYIGVGATAAASTSEWFSRLAALQALARITSPSAFATASAHTAYGPINVFILKHGSDWDWTPTNYPAAITFEPQQFSPSAFRIFRSLPDGTVLAVRRRD
jgi:hypothetical protein